MLASVRQRTWHHSGAVALMVRGALSVMAHRRARRALPELAARALRSRGQATARARRTGDDTVSTVLPAAAVQRLRPAAGERCRGFARPSSGLGRAPGEQPVPAPAVPRIDARRQPAAGRYLRRAGAAVQPGRAGVTGCPAVVRAADPAP